MRRRDEQFVEALTRAVALGGGTLDDNKLIAAYLASHQLGIVRMTDEQERRKLALARAKEKLQLTDIREALREIYETVDFDIVEAVGLHVQHIRGLEYEVPVRDPKTGITLTRKNEETLEWETVTAKAKDKPNYDALKDYLKVTLPQPAVRIDKRVLVGNVGRTPAPAIAARSISDEVIEGDFAEQD